MKIAAALLLSALFVSPSPAAVESPSLTVPHDWVAKQFTANTAGFVLMEMWYSPNGGGENIELGYSPNPDGANIVQAAPLVKTGWQRVVGAANVSDHAEKVCNGTVDGWLFRINMTMGASHTIIEEVILPSENHTFAAAYTRKSTEPEDRAARQSLDTLCVKA